MKARGSLSELNVCIDWGYARGSLKSPPSGKNRFLPLGREKLPAQPAQKRRGHSRAHHFNPASISILIQPDTELCRAKAHQQESIKGPRIRRLLETPAIEPKPQKTVNPDQALSDQ